MRLRFFVTFALAAATLTALPAYAQNPDAVTHFKRGKDLRDAGQCKEAVPEFQESLRIEESIGGFYNLGFCQDKLGNKQDALEAFTHARDLAKKKNDDRLREIGASRNALVDSSPHVTLTLPEVLYPGLAIHVDGTRIPSKYYSPGETVIFTSAAGSHVVHISAPGYEDRHITVTSDKAVPVELRRPPENNGVTPPPTKPAESGWMWQHWAGLGAAVVGTGLVVYGIASYVGYDVRRARLQRNFDEACTKPPDPEPPCTPQQAIDQRDARKAYQDNEDDASSSAPLWLGVGGFGALMVIGGVALIIVAPIGGGSSKTTGSSANVQLLPQVGPRMQGLSLTGTF